MTIRGARGRMNLCALAISALDTRTSIQTKMRSSIGSLPKNGPYGITKSVLFILAKRIDTVFLHADSRTLCVPFAVDSGAPSSPTFDENH